ncbi:MAG: KamA family radical SAM protein [Bacteroidales bacterium]|nr:KamA family radical SAM protein [Bacteroidales bacterium]MCB8999902.1 KamA family radical SAM protein [Bacteroidales bacterium]
MKSEEKHALTNASGEADGQEPPSKYGLRPSQKTTPVLKAKRDFPINDTAMAFKERFFPQASSNDWNDWQWQIRNSFSSLKQLETFLHLSPEEKAISEREFNLPMRVTPYYASLLDKCNPLQPLRRTVVPVIDELLMSPGEESDPLSEGHDSPVDLIVHRYPDRVLFLITGICSVYCRYCTRSHMVGKEEKSHPNLSKIDAAIEYISMHHEIRDVLLSGGDPLTMSDGRIEYVLSRLRAIKHVEIIRIGTKVPVVLPQRINNDLVKMLKKYHPLFISIHFTHPEEMTPETKTACNRLADAGIPLGSQTVLLKGVNDKTEIFTKLTHELLKARVRPYYLYQCDPIPGSSHFRTPVKKGLEIIKGLRGFTSGYAVPHYVIDAPGGGGKIPLLPDYFQGKEDGNIILNNYQDKKFKYPDYM